MDAAAQLVGYIPVGNMTGSADKFLSLIDVPAVAHSLDRFDNHCFFWLVALASAVVTGFELYSQVPHVLVKTLRPSAEIIPSTQEQQDHRLLALDIAFILFNKTVTVFFTYHLWQYTWNHCSWELQKATAATDVLCGLGHLVLLFIVYDFFYYWFHRVLHWKALYPLVHKHHHQSHAPFRGNLDAINVHPFEYVTGEYNHLFALYLLTAYAPWVGAVHAATVLVFIVSGGYFASLNHTRYHVCLTEHIFSVAAHDAVCTLF